MEPRRREASGCAPRDYMCTRDRAAHRPRIVRLTRWGGILLATALAACSRTATPPPSAGVTVDPTPWIADLATDDLFVSEPAAAKLVNLGDAVLPDLTAAYERGGAQQRQNILEVAGSIGTPRAIALLARGCADADDAVRDEAFDDLTDLPSPESSAAVERAIVEGGDRPSRSAVNACLALCRSSAALEQLLSDAIHGEPLSKRSVSTAAAQRLRSDPERRAVVDPLLDRLALPLLGVDTGASTRARAALLWAARDQATALPILLTYAEHGDDPFLRSLVLMAVGDVGDATAVPALLRLAASNDPSQRFSACRTLLTLQQRGIAPESPLCTPGVPTGKEHSQ